MHKGIIILVKAEDKEDALSQTRSFLASYQGSVWDWYQIGGRWQGTLSPLYDNFMKKAKEILKDTKGKGQYQSDVDAKADDLQMAWKEMGGEGPNPYSSQYHLPEDGGAYDVLPLENCLKVVKEWHYDHIEEGKREEKEAKQWLNREVKQKDGTTKIVKNYSMYGYKLKKAGEIFQQNFCFNCNVFNINTYDYSLPKEEEVKEYYAVMIDIHN